MNHYCWNFDNFDSLGDIYLSPSVIMTNSKLIGAHRGGEQMKLVSNHFLPKRTHEHPQRRPRVDLRPALLPERVGISGGGGGGGGGANVKCSTFLSSVRPRPWPKSEWNGWEGD